MKRLLGVLLSLLAFACTSPAKVNGDAPVTPLPEAQGPSPAGEQVDIYVMTAGGRGMKRLTRHPLADGTPVVWSRRGDRIMYGRGVEGTSGTYIMNVDGSDPVEFMPPQGASVAGS